MKFSCYLLNWRSIRFARELSSKAAWPRPALISDASTYFDQEKFDWRKKPILAEAHINTGQTTKSKTIDRSKMFLMPNNQIIIQQSIFRILTVPYMKCGIECIGFAQFFILCSSMFYLIVNTKEHGYEKFEPWFWSSDLFCSSSASNNNRFCSL